MRLSKFTVVVISVVFTATVGVVAPILVKKFQDDLNPLVDATVQINDSDSDAVIPVVAGSENPIPGDRASFSTFIARMKNVGKYARAGVMDVRLVVQGHHSRTVVVTNVSVRVVRREAAMAGTLVIAQGQGGVDAIPVGVELSAADLSVRNDDADAKSGPRKLGSPHFRGRVFTLHDDEVAAFQISVHATGGTYEWVVDVDLLLDGAPQKITAKSIDGPYRLSSYSPSYERIYDVMQYSGSTFPNVADFCPTSWMCEDVAW